MRRTTSRLCRSFIGPTLLLTLLALAGCGSGTAGQTSVLREPVSTTGANPFTPPMGTDQANVTAPPNSGGSFPGSTVGLFGGTENQSTCDKAQLVTFLQQDQAKAAAWAGVIGITVDQIPDFVASLTPVLLRSDTQVINHGFVNGKATEIPAVLQAGTAVLVDVHGAPVTKCFCGNPLKVPTATTSITFTGPQWPNFSSNNVTVVVPVTQTVQQFVVVEPGSGNSFQRPAGTAGRQDSPAPSPAPSTFVPPAPATPPTGGVTTTPGSAPPPGVVPTSTASLSPSQAASPPTGTSPSSPTTSPTTRSSSPSASPSASLSASPSVSPPVPPPGSPTASPTGSPTTPTPTPSASTSASPSPSMIVRASWVVGDCFVKAGRAHAVVLVQSDAATPHTFTVRVELGDPARPVAVETVKVTTPGPNQVAQTVVDVPTSTPDGRVQCAILSIMDKNGTTPVAGNPLPPPPDSTQLPGQPAPGQSTGPLPSAPTPVVPSS